MIIVEVTVPTPDPGRSQPATRRHELRHGGWVINDHGDLTVQDANYEHHASYAAGAWLEVRYARGTR